VTPAVDQLVAAGVDHRTITYENVGSDGFGEEAAGALGVDAGEVFKTLIVAIAGVGLAAALVPVSGRLDLKALARAAGAKKAELADTRDAERATGYVVGGISPFGQKGRRSTFVDVTALSLDTIYVSGGRRGLEIALAPPDLVSVLDATIADIAARP